LLEKTNLRLLEGVGERVDLITLDLSFISVLAVMPTVMRILKDNGQLIVLIKPQFEADKDEIGAGGIVRDHVIRNKIVERTVAGIEHHGLRVIGVTQSPIQGAKGNKEFLAYCVRK
jgi:23S rRNA (cytidine1920-2'-O)/16S rRNA (cytidine1409-2'-O)-methyltransferase